MRVIVPFDGRNPKSRLSPVLGPEEREAFASAMLSDVATAIESAGYQPTILATTEPEVTWPVISDFRSLDVAVNEILDTTEEAVGIVMADLALVTPDVIESFFDTRGEVVLAPGLGGGTNAIIARHPDFRVDYHGASIRDHRAIADRIGATLTEVDSLRMASDVDEPADLVEVLLHGEGKSATRLGEQGFEIAIEDGRVDLERAD